MTELLQLMYEYRQLVSRRDRSHGVLNAANQERLTGLERLFGKERAEGDSPGHRRYARCDTKWAATLQVGNRTEPVEIINIGGGGVRILGVPELEPGQRSILHIPSLDSASEYHFPVEVSWIARHSGSPIMGMPFRSVPSQVWLPS